MKDLKHKRNKVVRLIWIAGFFSLWHISNGQFLTDFVKLPENGVMDVVHMNEREAWFVSTRNEVRLWNFSIKKYVFTQQFSGQRIYYVQVLDNGQIALFVSDNYYYVINQKGETVKKIALNMSSDQFKPGNSVYRLSGDGTTLFLMRLPDPRNSVKPAYSVYEIGENEIKKVLKLKDDLEELDYALKGRYTGSTFFTATGNYIVRSNGSDLNVYQYSKTGLKRYQSLSYKDMKGNIVSFKVNDAQDKIVFATRQLLDRTYYNDSIRIYEYTFPELKLIKAHPAEKNLGDGFVYHEPSNTAYFRIGRTEWVKYDMNTSQKGETVNPGLGDISLMKIENQFGDYALFKNEKAFLRCYMGPESLEKYIKRTEFIQSEERKRAIEQLFKPVDENEK